MNKNNLYPYCDYKCPLHEQCSWYLDKINKSKVVHWGKEPYDYKKGGCKWFVSMGLDELITKINNYLKPFES